MADYSEPTTTSTAVGFKKGTDIDSYTTKVAGDLLLATPTTNTDIAKLYYCDGTNIRHIIPYEYGTSLPTSNNYEGKVFFKII